MKLPIFFASGQGMIPALCAMILTPYALIIVSLAFSVFKRCKPRSVPAIVLASVGCAWGLWLLILFELPKTAQWTDLVLFLPFPLGVIALFASLRRGKEDS
jgi:hypothetical protein